MTVPLSKHVSPQASPLDTESGRQRLVTVALNLTRGTALAPEAYEQMLLDQFVRGVLTLDEVLTRLNEQEQF